MSIRPPSLWLSASFCRASRCSPPARARRAHGHRGLILDRRRVARAGETPTTGEAPAPLSGIADLHLHMFAEEAFGGGWFHGSHRGAGEVALAPCDGGDPGDHARLQDDLAPLLGTCEGVDLAELGAMVPLIAVIRGGAAAGSSASTSARSPAPRATPASMRIARGWPDLSGWPRWDAIAHQQAWEGQLHDAYMAGLRIEVMSAVSLDWLCRAIPPENLERPQCDEMDDVRLQLSWPTSSGPARLGRDRADRRRRATDRRGGPAGDRRSASRPRT